VSFTGENAKNDGVRYQYLKNQARDKSKNRFLKK
ncbi:uncharacterized protein METZ01_LOCUS485026, partial [marine metagenome]